MPSEHWRRYVAPAAFLLAATVAVILVRSGIESGGSKPSSTTNIPSVLTTKHTITTAPSTTAKKPIPAARFWTVQAGDTFGVISSKTGIPVATIEQLNPNVHSTSLHIGEKIRLK